jgi:hypothetical protein
MIRKKFDLVVVVAVLAVVATRQKSWCLLLSPTCGNF